MPPVFERDFQRTLLLGSGNLHGRFPSTGLSPSLVVRSRNTIEFPTSGVTGPSTCPATFIAGFGLPYGVFDRLY